MSVTLTVDSTRKRSPAVDPGSPQNRIAEGSPGDRRESFASGLTPDQVSRQLEKYGHNELPEKKKNPILQFLSYFWGPIPWMIESAAILSAIVHHWADFGIVLTLLAGNAIRGFWEEHQAGKTVSALKSGLALRARVKRAGEWTSIEARLLVPGDIIRLRPGDIVPADARLLDGDPLSIDQSSITGESLPVSGKPGTLAYAGSIVMQGEIDSVVEATGLNTCLGRTATLVESAPEKSHFQKAILKIGDYLILAALILVGLILAAAILRGDRLATAIEFALVLTVAAIPVAMPTVLSVTLAVGAQILARRKAIVTRLASIEDLAGIDVLCSDKTGTLTQNRHTLGEPFCLVGVSPEQLLEDAALASRAEDEDPIDLAVLGGSNQDRAQVEVIHFQRFDPVSERTEATVRAGDRVFRVTKGAPQVILKLASNADQVRSEVESAVNDFTSRGFRTLGVARTNGRKEWEFLGILPLFDPPREDSRQVIRAAEDLGIQVKMVTGDQVAIAREISRRLNLGTRILDAERLDVNEPGAETALASAIENSDGFAQVYPEHKDQIVDVLQQHGHTVGMTGEGANDAPALKKADAGIAVSGATDAARDASDIVLTSPGLSVIVDAIRESRHIVQRMNAYAIYRITETIRLLVFMTLSILVFNFYPVTAAMIVLLALLNEGPILAIAYDFVRPSPKPEKWNMPLALGVSTVLGLAGVAASFGLLYIAEHLFNLPSGVIQTLMFLKLAIAGQLTIFITRTRGPFWSLRPSPVLLWLAVGTKVLATLAAVYGILMPAIGWNWAVIIWAYAFAWFFINDGIKIATYRLLEQHPPTIWGGQTAGYPQPEARHV